MRRATRRWLRALGLAAITGSRTALGPALVCRRPRGAGCARGTRLLAALELVGDKLPRMPPPDGAAGARASAIVSAAGVVRAMLKRRQGGRRERARWRWAPRWRWLGAFAGLRLRLALTRLLGGGALANAMAGAIEDAALIAVGRRLAAVR